MAIKGLEALGCPVRGVFSTDKEMKIGFGATKRTVLQNVLVYVEEDDKGRLWGQAINENDVPSGDRYGIKPEELLSSYLPDPSAYHARVLPAVRKLNKTIARAERHRKHGELFSAEHEFQNALGIDEDNVRATFGLGFVYMDREEPEKAQRVFERLIDLDAAFAESHKHMFNEFGIKLRKTGMFSEALRFYARAAKLTGKDDHLLYNIARSLMEAGNKDEALKYTDMALALNPKLQVASKLKNYAEKKQR